MINCIFTFMYLIAISCYASVLNLHLSKIIIKKICFRLDITVFYIRIISFFQGWCKIRICRFFSKFYQKNQPNYQISNDMVSGTLIFVFIYLYIVNLLICNFKCISLKFIIFFHWVFVTTLYVGHETTKDQE